MSLREHKADARRLGQAGRICALLDQIGEQPEYVRLNTAFHGRHVEREFLVELTRFYKPRQWRTLGEVWRDTHG